MEPMTEPIRTDADVMREVADVHDEVVRHIETARQRGTDIFAAVETFGPIMHQVKATVSDLLTDRDDSLAAHATRHRNAGDELRRGAALYVGTDQRNAAKINQVPNS
jgi:hypothetical protein